MSSYEKMYFELFHAITSTVSMLNLVLSEQRGTTGAQKEQAFEAKIELAIVKLRNAQQKTEQIYMEH